MGDIATFCSGGTPLTSKREYFDGDIPFIRSGEINSDKTEQFITELGLKNSSAKLVNAGDILYALYGATSGEVGISKINGAINQAILCIKSTENHYFIFSFLSHKKEVITRTYLQGGQGNLSAEIVKQIELSIPSINEQQKMSNFLLLVDDRIQTQKKIIEVLSLQKISIVKKLFENKIKFKTDNKTHSWERKKLSEISEEHLHKNPNNKYNEVFSVAKHKGVINQIEHLGRSFSAKEILHYKLVYPGDLVYTKSPTSDFPFGIIKQNRTGRIGVVSPLYCVFTPKTYALGYLLHEYFNSSVNTFNYLNPLVQKGAKNTMNINNEIFLNGASILLPMDEEEQKKIYELLLCLDEKINLETELLTQYENQKKYLLQNLFI